MICEPRAHVTVVALLLLCQELLKESEHAVRADAGVHHVMKASFVRLHFVCAAELREDRRPANVDCRGRCLVAADVGQRARERDTDVRALHLLHLLHGVTAHDMLDLVAHHSRQLVHAIGALENAAVHIDDSARQREGVHDVRVDDIELPLQVSARRVARDLVAERIHVLIDDRVLDERELLPNLSGLLLSELDLLLLRHSAGADPERHR